MFERVGGDACWSEKWLAVHGIVQTVPMEYYWRVRASGKPSPSGKPQNAKAVVICGETNKIVIARRSSRRITTMCLDLLIAVRDSRTGGLER